MVLGREDETSTGAIVQQKVEAPAEGFGKAERVADKRWRRDKSGATTMTTIL
jgi:hypothetical protein